MLQYALENEKNAKNYGYWKEIKANQQNDEFETELSLKNQSGKEKVVANLNVIKNMGAICYEKGATMRKLEEKTQELEKKRFLQMYY